MELLALTVFVRRNAELSRKEQLGTGSTEASAVGQSVSHCGHKLDTVCFEPSAGSAIAGLVASLKMLGTSAHHALL